MESTTVGAIYLHVCIQEDAFVVNSNVRRGISRHTSMFEYCQATGSRILCHSFLNSSALRHIGVGIDDPLAAGELKDRVLLTFTWLCPSSSWTTGLFSPHFAEKRTLRTETIPKISFNLFNLCVFIRFWHKKSRTKVNRKSERPEDGGTMIATVYEEIERPDHGSSKAAKLRQQDERRR